MLFSQYILFFALWIIKMQSYIYGIKIHRGFWTKTSDRLDFLKQETCIGKTIENIYANLCTCKNTTDTFYEENFKDYCSTLEDIRNIEGCHKAISIKKTETIDLICPIQNSKNSVTVYIRNKNDENTKAFWDESFSQDIVSNNINIINDEKIEVNQQTYTNGLLMKITYTCQNKPDQCVIVKYNDIQSYPFVWEGPKIDTTTTTTTPTTTMPTTTTPTTTLPTTTTPTITKPTITTPTTTTPTTTTPTTTTPTPTTTTPTTTTPITTISSTETTTTAKGSQTNVNGTEAKKQNSGDDKDDGNNLLPVIVAVVAAGVVLIVILVVLKCYCLRKSKRKEKDASIGEAAPVYTSYTDDNEGKGKGTDRNKNSLKTDINDSPEYRSLEAGFANEAYTGLDTDNTPMYHVLEQPEAIYRELEPEQDNLYDDPPKSFGTPVAPSQQPNKDEFYAEGYYSAVIPPPQKQINLDELYAPIVKNRK